MEKEDVVWIGYQEEQDFVRHGLGFQQVECRSYE